MQASFTAAVRARTDAVPLGPARAAGRSLRGRGEGARELGPARHEPGVKVQHEIDRGDIWSLEEGEFILRSQTANMHYLSFDFKIVFLVF